MLVVSLLLVLVMIFTACAPATPKQEAPKEEPKTEAPKEDATKTEEPKEAKEVVIKFWNFPNFSGDTEFTKSSEYDKALVAAFEAKNPGIKVETQAIEFTDGPAKLETALQTQTNPDVIYDAPGRIIDWASKGYLVDLEDIVPKDKLIPAAVKASSYEGKVYMYPQGVAPFMMGFNLGMAKELGIENMLPLDKEDRTWTVEEFEALLTKFHELKPELPPTILFAKSQGGDQGPRAFISNLYGSWITDEAVTKYTINDENGIKAMEWAKKAYDNGLLGKGIALDAGASIEAFRSANAFSTILYPVVLYKQDVVKGELETVLLPFPNNSGKPELEYLVAGPAVFDNGDADKIAAAKKFVDFMINDPDWGMRTLKSTGTFSAKLGEVGLYDDPELLFAETMSKYYGPYYNTIPGFAQMRPIWFPMVQGVLNGDIAPKEALDKFVEQANMTIEDAK